MNYTEITASAPVVLVEFYADWCHHCKNMMPVLAQVTESLGEAIPTYQIDIDGEPKTASENGVYKVPTFIIYAGGHEKWRHVGEIAGAELMAKVRSYL